ncbi:superoxide dismutase family protein [Pontimicrobium aquaticum]|uniref:Superoxide dismutase family protein n=1 Tax=Pontimicrobium aquaticum TaxID=2565367 RepID=A0A4U0EWA4_9FLAO|nr:superoxide dismutase family protein [Pontimicrobium aquaticum]TJY36193.1 superoxide dismutase family protein [Pontimicrobium aquaticum]
MKKISVFALAFTLAFTTSCKSDKKETNTTETEVESTNNTEKTTTEKSYDGGDVWVNLNAKSGSSVKGTAVFENKGDSVSMLLTVSGLEPGEHAVHLHEKSDCSAEDGTSTGGHWNPTGQPHGKWGADEGYHKGDIGNFTASDNGKATFTFATDEWCIGCGDDTKDILGKAIIIHQGTDDFTTQPTGAAGGRISCGGVIQ